MNEIIGSDFLCFPNPFSCGINLAFKMYELSEERLWGGFFKQMVIIEIGGNANILFHIDFFLK